jgi:hypothetical protein
MQQQTISQSADFMLRSERRIDLDWVRISAFGLLIFYHVGMLYVSWGFHIKSAHRIALEPLMLVLNPWRLGLLFLVSGVATRFMLRKYSLLPLLRSRSARLLIPLVFGMLVVVPPQAYEQVVEALGYPAGFVDFYLRHYLAFGSQFCPKPCIVMPTWNHLWFVVYLWVYTVALGGVLAWVPGLVEWIERKLASALSGALLLVVPTLAFATFRLVLFPNFPSTHALFGDWYNHAQFATVFLLGFCSLRRRPFGSYWRSVGSPSQRPCSCLWYATARDAACRLALRLRMAPTNGCAWSPSLASPALAHRIRTRRYLTDAIFPYYACQTAIIMIAHALRGSGLSVGVGRPSSSPAPRQLHCHHEIVCARGLPVRCSVEAKAGRSWRCG